MSKATRCLSPTLAHGGQGVFSRTRVFLLFFIIKGRASPFLPRSRPLPSNRRRLPCNRRRLPTNRRRLLSNCRQLPSNRHRLPSRSVGGFVVFKNRPYRTRFMAHDGN